MKHSDYVRDSIYFEQNGPFIGRFEFDQILKYTSNVALFKDGNGCNFYMAQGEFEGNIKYMIRGVLEGRFYFHKQGKYYSLKYIPDAVI
jgi:hypothetical protein